jgi:hypothetical protein
VLPYVVFIKGVGDLTFFSTAPVPVDVTFLVYKTGLKYLLVFVGYLTALVLLATLVSLGAKLDP